MTEEENIINFEPAPRLDDDGEPGDGNSDDSGDSDSDGESSDPSAEIIQSDEITEHTISQHRKAYVKWVNESFYENLKDLKKDSSLKIYQILVQNL